MRDDREDIVEVWVHVYPQISGTKSVDSVMELI